MKPAVVFFNASVILSGLKSPKGGSAKLINWCQKKKIKGIISEIVLDEIRRNLSKIKINNNRIKKAVLAFSSIEPAPTARNVNKFLKIVIDPGDAHVLASGLEAKAKYLVSLDKKHILVLQNQITNYKIVNPKELIKRLS